MASPDATKRAIEALLSVRMKDRSERPRAERLVAKAIDDAVEEARAQERKPGPETDEDAA